MKNNSNLTLIKKQTKMDDKKYLMDQIFKKKFQRD